MQNNNNRGNRNPNNAGAAGNQSQAGNDPNRKDFNAKKDNSRMNYRKSNKNDFYKKPQQRYGAENYVTRIANPKRDESVEDIKMDIDKLEKDIQFEVKQIRSVKLGL